MREKPNPHASQAGASPKASLTVAQTRSARRKLRNERRQSRSPAETNPVAKLGSSSRAKAVTHEQVVAGVVSGRDTTRTTAEPETKPATAATRQATLRESVETEDVQQDPKREVKKASKVRAEEEDGTSTEPRM